MRLRYTNNNLYVARKYARIFVRGHYLFHYANSLPRAKPEENCELRGTNSVKGKCTGTLSRKIEAIVFSILKRFCNAREKLFTNCMKREMISLEYKLYKQ